MSEETTTQQINKNPFTVEVADGRAIQALPIPPLDVGQAPAGPRHRGDDLKSWGGLQPVYVAPYPNFSLEADRWKLQVSSKYRDLIKALGLADHVLELKYLGYKGYACLALNCGVDKVYYPMYKCGSLHPYANQKHVSRVCSNLFSKIEATKADYVICIDLTLDKFFSAYPDYKRIKMLQGAVKDFFAHLQHELNKTHPSQLGGWAAVHTWSSLDPLSPKLHAHLALVNMALNKKEKTLYRIQPFIDHHLVKLLWAQACKKLGWVEEGQAVDVHLRLIAVRDRAKLFSRLKYMFRKPIVDLNENLLSFGPEDLDFARHLINYVPRIRALGYMTRLKAYAICRKIRNPLCPICGAELHFIGKFRDLPPGVVKACLDKQGNIRPWPPSPDLGDKYGPS